MPKQVKPKRIKLTLYKKMCEKCYVHYQTTVKEKKICFRCEEEWNKVDVEGLQANTLMW